MNFPTDITTWLKLVGAGSAGLGSLLLAWRARKILAAMKFSLMAHEHAIATLVGSMRPDPDLPIRVGSAVEIMDFESRAGLVTLVFGFLLLGVGQLATAASFLL